jgi:hypothetical protein
VIAHALDNDNPAGNVGDEVQEVGVPPVFVGVPPEMTEFTVIVKGLLAYVNAGTVSFT